MPALYVSAQNVRGYFVWSLAKTFAFLVILVHLQILASSSLSFFFAAALLWQFKTYA